MYTIFFNKRALIICNDSSRVKQPDAVYVYAPCGNLPPEVPSLFSDSENIAILAIITDNMDEVFRRVCGNFRQIDAAGGLVENEKGEFLFILRNGVWDLPKGKAEEGESIESTALREVNEECGLQHIELGEPICITRHCYRLNGEIILKHTHWFKMRCNSNETLVPQSEEGIERLKWVARREVGRYAGITYPSLREVLAGEISQKSAGNSV